MHALQPCGDSAALQGQSSEAAALNHEQELSPAFGRNEAHSHVKHNVFIAKIGLFSVASIHKVFSPYLYTVNVLSAATSVELRFSHGLAPRCGCPPCWTPQPSQRGAVAQVGSSGGGARLCPWAEGEAGEGAVSIHMSWCHPREPPSPGSRRRCCSSHRAPAPRG